MSNYDVSVLKNNIKTLMHEGRITQAMLSKKIGIPQARISKILSDRTSDSFTIPQLVDIADYLGVSTDILLFGEEKMAEKQNKKRLSVKEICAMLVQIDKTVRFCIDIKEFEEDAIMLSDRSNIVSVKTNVKHPTMYFLEQETMEEINEDVYINIFDSNTTSKSECWEINRFFEKYVELRRLRDKDIIDPETFEEIIAVHISKLRSFPIIDRTDADAVIAAEMKYQEDGKGDDIPWD